VERTERTERDEDLLLLSEVSELTRLPEATIRWHRHQGTGPKGFVLGRRLMFRRGEVKKWIREREEADAPVMQEQKPAGAEAQQAGVLAAEGGSGDPGPGYRPVQPRGRTREDERQGSTRREAVHRGPGRGDHEP
jgi:predicted DNA-binding transcriptional regulator AlpA